MSEIQRVVDELRFLLQREAIEQTEEMNSLLARYSEFCHEVNSRLRKCGELVKRGLRSEAMQLAEVAPNLLDAVAVLDFPEREQFLDVISMYFLASPEPLLLDVASALNEAYAEHEPLKKLLDAQRLLVLARSPLSQRLPVLQSLADLDEASPHWDADVREMERARLREIETESRTASKRGDSVELKALLTEVQSTKWREPVPSSVLKDLKARANQSVRAHALQRMAELNQELHAAFAALDVVGARKLRDEWNRKQQVAQVAEADPLFDQIVPILDWLSEVDRGEASEKGYLRSVADIERALEADEVTSSDLKRLALVVDRHDRGLPASLESRFRSRLAAVELTEARRSRLWVGGGVAAFALFVAIFAVMVQSSYHAEQTRRLVAAISEFIDDGKLDEARKIMDQQATRPTTDSWLAVQKKLSDAEQTERDRVVQLQSELQRARQSTEAVRVEAAIKRARELARTTEDKIAVGNLESTWQKRVADETALREREFREAIKSATTALQDLDAAIRNSSDTETRETALNAANLTVLKLRESQGKVSSDLRSQAMVVDARLQASRSAIAESKRVTDFLDRLTTAVLLRPESVRSIEKADEASKVMREFATTIPNDPRAGIFKSAADSCPLRAIVSRQLLAHRWRGLVPANEKDLEIRMGEVHSYVTDYPQSPDLELMKRYEKWLASIERRYSDDGDPDAGLLRRMISLFSSKFIADGHTLRDTKDRTYYLPVPRTEKFGSIATFSYLVGFNGESKKTSGLSATDFLSHSTISPPQAEIAKKVRTSARTISSDKWNSYFQDLAETLLQAKDVDPFLRYLLLLKTLEFAGAGDLLLEKELEEVLEALIDDDLDRTVAWMDPDNKGAEKARERAKELLAAVPPLAPIFARAAETQQQFESELITCRFSIGWLEKTSKGEWVCRTKWSASADYTLFAVSPADSKGSRAWITLGQFRDRSFVIESDPAQTVGEIAIVFAMPAKGTQKTAQLPK